MTAEIPYSIHPLSKPPRATRRLQGPGLRLSAALLSPAPRLQRWRARSPFPPTSHFQRYHDNQTFPIQRKPWRGHQKRSCCLEAARISPYTRARTGHLPVGRVWGCTYVFVVRDETPHQRETERTLDSSSAAWIFLVSRISAAGLGNGTLRASASQILGAVLLLRAEGRRGRVPGPESWLSHFEIDVPRASPIIKVLGGHLFLSTQWSRVRSSRTLLPPRAVGVPMRPSSFVTQKPRHKSRRGLHHLSLGSIANVKVVCKMRIPSQFYASSILRHSFSRYGIPTPRYTANQKPTDLSINGTASSSHSVQPLKLPRADICTCFVSAPLFPSGTSSCLQSLMQVQSSHALHA